MAFDLGAISATIGLDLSPLEAGVGAVGSAVDQIVTHLERIGDVAIGVAIGRQINDVVTELERLPAALVKVESDLESFNATLTASFARTADQAQHLLDPATIDAMVAGATEKMTAGIDKATENMTNAQHNYERETQASLERMAQHYADFAQRAQRNVEDLNQKTSDIQDNLARTQGNAVDSYNTKIQNAEFTHAETSQRIAESMANVESGVSTKLNNIASTAADATEKATHAHQQAIGNLLHSIDNENESFADKTEARQEKMSLAIEDATANHLRAVENFAEREKEVADKAADAIQRVHEKLANTLSALREKEYQEVERYSEQLQKIAAEATADAIKNADNFDKIFEVQASREAALADSAATHADKIQSLQDREEESAARDNLRLSQLNRDESRTTDPKQRQRIEDEKKDIADEAALRKAASDKQVEEENAQYAREQQKLEDKYSKEEEAAQKKYNQDKEKSEKKEALDKASADREHARIETSIQDATRKAEHQAKTELDRINKSEAYQLADIQRQERMEGERYNQSIARILTQAAIEQDTADKAHARTLADLDRRIAQENEKYVRQLEEIKKNEEKKTQAAKEEGEKRLAALASQQGRADAQQAHADANAEHMLQRQLSQAQELADKQVAAAERANTRRNEDNDRQLQRELMQQQQGQQARDDSYEQHIKKLEEKLNDLEKKRSEAEDEARASIDKSQELAKTEWTDAWIASSNAMEDKFAEMQGRVDAFHWHKPEGDSPAEIFKNEAEQYQSYLLDVEARHNLSITQLQAHVNILRTAGIDPVVTSLHALQGAGKDMSISLLDIVATLESMPQGMGLQKQIDRAITLISDGGPLNLAQRELNSFGIRFEQIYTEVNGRMVRIMNENHTLNEKEGVNRAIAGDAILKYLDDFTKEYMRNLQGTYGQLVSTMQSFGTILSRTMGKELFKETEGAMADFIAFIRAHRDLLTDLGETIGHQFGTMAKTIIGWAKMLGELGDDPKYALWQYVGNILGALGRLKDSVISVMGDIFKAFNPEGLGTSPSEVLATIGDKIDDLARIVKESGPEVASIIKSFVDQLVEWGKWVFEHRDEIVKFFEDVFDKIKEGYKFLIEHHEILGKILAAYVALNVIRNVVGLLTDLGLRFGVVNGAIRGFYNVLIGIDQIITSVAGAITNVLAAALSGIGRVLGGITSLVESALSGLAGVIARTISAAFAAVEPMIASALAPLRTSLGILFTEIANFGLMGVNVGPALKAIGEDILLLGSRALSAIPGLVGLKDIFVGLGSLIGSTLAPLRSALGLLFTEIRNFGLTGINVGPALRVVADEFALLARNATTAVRNLVAGVVAPLAALASRISGSEITGAFRTAFSSLSNVALASALLFNATMARFGEGITALGKALGSDVVVRDFSRFATAVSASLRSFQEGTALTLRLIGGEFRQGFALIPPILTAAQNTISGALNGIRTAVTTFFTNLATSLRGSEALAFFRVFVGDITSTLSLVRSTIVGGFQALLTASVTFFQNLATSFRGSEALAFFKVFAGDIAGAISVGRAAIATGFGLILREFTLFSAGITASDLETRTARAISPVARTVTAQVNPIASAFGTIITRVGAIIAQIPATVALLAGPQVMTAFAGARTAIAASISLFVAAFAGIATRIAAINLGPTVVAVLASIIIQLNALQIQAGLASSGFIAALGRMATYLAGPFIAVLTAARLAVLGFFATLSLPVSVPLGLLATGVVATALVVTGKYQDMGRAVDGFLSKLVEDMPRSTKIAFTQTTNDFERGTLVIGALWHQLMVKLGLETDSTIDTIFKELDKLGPQLHNTLESIDKVSVPEIQTMISRYQALLTQLTGQIGPEIDAQRDIILKSIALLEEKLKEKAPAIAGAIPDALRAATPEVDNAMQGMTGVAKTNMEDFRNNIVSILGQGATGGIDAANRLADGVVQAMEGLDDNTKAIVTNIATMMANAMANSNAAAQAVELNAARAEAAAARAEAATAKAANAAGRAGATTRPVAPSLSAPSMPTVSGPSGGGGLSRSIPAPSSGSSGSGSGGGGYSAPTPPPPPTPPSRPSGGSGGQPMDGRDANLLPRGSANDPSPAAAYKTQAGGGYGPQPPDSYSGGGGGGGGYTGGSGVADAASHLNASASSLAGASSHLAASSNNLLGVAAPIEKLGPSFASESFAAVIAAAPAAAGLFGRAGFAGTYDASLQDNSKLDMTPYLGSSFAAWQSGSYKHTGDPSSINDPQGAGIGHTLDSLMADAMSKAVQGMAPPTPNTGPLATKSLPDSGGMGGGGGGGGGGGAEQQKPPEGPEVPAKPAEHPEEPAGPRDEPDRNVSISNEFGTFIVNGSSPEFIDQFVAHQIQLFQASSVSAAK